VIGVSGSLISGAFLDGRADEMDGHAFAATLGALGAVARACGPASSSRALLETGAHPLLLALGFTSMTDVRDHGGNLVATIAGPVGGAVAVVVAPFAARLDGLWAAAVSAARERGADWAVVYNGSHLRLVDTMRLHARRHLEFDLDLAATPRGATILQLTLAAGRLTSRGGESTRALVEASDAHASAVCRSLRDGVLSASTDVLDALTRRRRRGHTNVSHDTFEQALTIVYRLLFLLFAEARGLVPLWHPVYHESYSVEALRAAAERPSGAIGLWDAVRAMTRLAHAGCRAGDLLVTPFNGRLFAPSRTPLADRRDLDDEKARSAVMALSTRSNRLGNRRERITYGDLGVEQLGAVYETLLDYEPCVSDHGVELRAQAGTRKTTGTFYTPQPVADAVVRQTLEPLVRGRTVDAILDLRIVDAAMGSGAFLVAAIRFLAAAYESALVAAGDCLPHEIADVDRALFRRRVAERCLYGVDVNPMAVQLARLSLWLATLAADRPLSFLDHRLMTGDSLVGAWISQLCHAPRPRRARPQVAPALFADDALDDALRDTLPVRFSLETTPNDTLAQVREKERAHAAATGRHAAVSRWKRVDDAWCATWFSSQLPAAAFTAVSDALVHGGASLPRKLVEAYLADVAATSQAHAFFHWELEYPEVFFDAAGARRLNAGFDAVIGNPPWNIVHAESVAFLRFARNSGVYDASLHGHANRYQLFVERALALTRRGGRVGLVLPWGFAADHGSAPLRRLVFSRTNVDSLVAIDNHRGVFPIHRSVRFMLVTATAGESTGHVACRFGINDLSALETHHNTARHTTGMLSLSPTLLERLSGPSLAIPFVRHAIDLAVAERAASLFAPLGDAAGWHVTFGRELNATDDRALFRPRGRGWPLVEGKHLSPFHVDVAAASRSVSAPDARRALGAHRGETPRLAYRDVASATNKMTLIAALLPSRCVSTHTIFCLRTPLPLRVQHFLCGMFNSFLVNFLVRMRVTTHVTTAIVEQLPVPTWDVAPAAAMDIAALARFLARRHDAAAFARLNALVASLYQLTEEEFSRVLETFPLVETAERTGAMEAFVAMNGRR
jgi:hypothetical protein